MALRATAALASLLYALSCTAAVLPHQAPLSTQNAQTLNGKNITGAFLYPPNYAPSSTPNHMAVDASKQPWNIQPSSEHRLTASTKAACSPLTADNPSLGHFWYHDINHNGESPFIPGGSSWKVYRNVLDYGADPSGQTDSSAAIQRAINDGAPTSYDRSKNQLGTTGQPAVVYLPAGVYLMQNSLQMYVDTVLMGDPMSPPTLHISPSFGGSTFLYGKDPNQGATINFYIAIKNLVIDSTPVNKDQKLVLLDWSVSQACQLTNVVFNMPNYSSGHIGISMPEGGSATMMGDLTFNGGLIGLQLSNQQYELKSMTFNGCATSIDVAGCFDCVFTNMNFMNSGTGIEMTASGLGSIVLLDSTASNINIVVHTNNPYEGYNSLVIENFVKGSGVNSVVTSSGNNVLNDNVPNAWVSGYAYTPGGGSTQTSGTTYNIGRSSALLQNGKFVTVAPPTYQQYSSSKFINVKSVSGYPVYGDGNHDDTNNLNHIISTYAGCNILFFPQGTYIVTNTLFFPAGSRVVGEAWTAISATGSNFYNPASPTVMVKVGNAGDKGVAQFSDMLFTVADVLQGCTLLEVNIAGNNPGDVGFWNTHFRVGGAAGSKVQTNCGGAPASCKAAFMMMHLTSSSSAYVENMWGWTADHDLDGGHGQTISTGRGFLIEATAGTWLHGTASEHNTLYQYNLNKASNVFIGMQQSETPYWQGNGSPSIAPSPWSTISSIGDPSYSNCGSSDGKCRMAWFEIVSHVTNVYIYGSGFWAFFENNSQSCGNSCQSNGIEVFGSDQLWWFGINTHTVDNALLDGGSAVITAGANPGGWGTCVAAYLRDEN